MKSYPYEIYDTKLKTLNFGTKSKTLGNRVLLFINDDNTKYKVWAKHRLIMKQFNPDYNDRTWTDIRYCKI